MLASLSPSRDIFASSLSRRALALVLLSISLNNCSTFRDPDEVILEEDQDGDEFSDRLDNCPQRLNPTQQDFDENGIGDLCEAPLVIEMSCLRPPLESTRFSNSCAASISCEDALQSGEPNDYRVILDDLTLSDGALRGNFACAYLRGMKSIGSISLEGIFCRADLTEAQLSGARFVGERGGYQNLVAAGAELPELCAVQQDLSGANFQSAILSGAQLQKASLRNAKLRNADLQGASFIYTDLRDADLVGADLRGVDLRCADLRGVDLSRSDLRGVDLRFVWLEDSTFTDAQLDGALLPTGFPSGARLYVREQIDRRGESLEDGSPACSLEENQAITGCPSAEVCRED